MSVRLLTEEDKERWDRYVLESGISSGYHLSGWRKVIEDSFGHATWYLLSEDNEKRINGILPLVQLKSILFGNFMVSLPYFTYGGVCADSDEISDQLVHSAVECTTSCKSRHIEMRHDRPAATGLPVKTEKVAMRLSLANGLNELWKSFPSKLRSQIRRPEKEGMQVKFGKQEELDNFYKVFSTNMRDLGTPVYPKYFFGNILKTFPEATRICTVYTKDGCCPVASGFLFGFKDRLEIPWASSLRRYNHSSPNMLLYWSVLQFACEGGYNSFDFGRSTAGEGTYKFKEQWGAQPVQLYWYYWVKNGGPLPRLNPRNPKYLTAINIWRRLPVAFTRVIGPSIVKNLP